MEKVFEEMISYQRGKLLQIAREILPSVVEDDLLQPFDFPELERHPDFRYEEGVLQGILTALTAWRSQKVLFNIDHLGYRGSS